VLMGGPDREGGPRFQNTGVAPGDPENRVVAGRPGVVGRDVPTTQFFVNGKQGTRTGHTRTKKKGAGSTRAWGAFAVREREILRPRQTQKTGMARGGNRGAANRDQPAGGGAGGPTTTNVPILLPLFTVTGLESRRGVSGRKKKHRHLTNQTVGPPVRDRVAGWGDQMPIAPARKVSASWADRSLEGGGGPAGSGTRKGGGLPEFGARVSEWETTCRGGPAPGVISGQGGSCGGAWTGGCRQVGQNTPQGRAGSPGLLLGLADLFFPLPVCGEEKNFGAEKGE